MKLLLPFILAIFWAHAHAQVIVGNFGIQYVATAPSGSCSSNSPIQVVVGPGSVYSCQDGVWGEVAGGGGGAVNEVVNTDGTLTISPTTGNVVARVNLAHAFTWTGLATFNAGASIASAQCLNWNSDSYICRSAANEFTFGASNGNNSGNLNASGYLAGTTLQVSSFGIMQGSGVGPLWSSTNAYNGTKDVGIDRSAAGVLEINNGTIGNALGSLTLENLTVSGTCTGCGGGGGSPAGPNGSLQYNNSGSFGGSTLQQFASGGVGLGAVSDPGVGNMAILTGLSVGSAGTPSLISFTSMTVAALQAVTGMQTGDYREVSDAATQADCSVGGGTTNHWCYYNGSTWLSAAPSALADPGGNGLLARTAFDTTSLATLTGDCTNTTAGGFVLNCAKTMTTLTDSASVTWTVSGVQSNAKLTMANTTATRAINISGLAVGDYLTLEAWQDATGGALLTGGTGCTWYVGGSNGYTASANLVTALNTAPASGFNMVVVYYDGANCITNVR